MRENPKPFEVYRHFKGNMYQIITLATDSEDGSLKVVYQALYGDYKVYVRDLEMFLSETDHEKYPKASQKYRFEKTEPGSNAWSEQVPVKKEEAPAAEIPQERDGEIDPGVLEYLDAESVDARLNILTSMHHRITDEMINTMALVEDFEINEGSTEKRYQELKNCLLTKQKFEKKRY